MYANFLEPNYMQQIMSRRRILTSRSEPIRVGIPARSMFKQLVKSKFDPKTNVTSYDGFSLKVFEETMNIVDVKNDFPYNYFSFDGEYDDFGETNSFRGKIFQTLAMMCFGKKLLNLCIQIQFSFI